MSARQAGLTRRRVSKPTELDTCIRERAASGACEVHNVHDVPQNPQPREVEPIARRSIALRFTVVIAAGTPSGAEVSSSNPTLQGGEPRTAAIEDAPLARYI
ncbi:MAG TPA: hypothetical protein VGB79_13145 [Allosphingosinicella sp.]